MSGSRPYDTVITGGMVVDGTRMPRRRCDVGIRDGLIAKLGRIDPSQADHVTGDENASPRT